MKKAILAVSILLASSVSYADQTSVTRSEYNELKAEIKEVDNKDARVVSGNVNDQSVLKLKISPYDRAKGYDSYVDIDVSKLDQSKEVKENKESITKNSEGITTNKADITTVKSGVDENKFHIESTKVALTKEVVRATERDLYLAGRVDTTDHNVIALNNRVSSNTNRIESLESDVGSLKTSVKRLTKGVAMSGAFAMGAGMNTDNHEFTVTPSIASYEGETALAIQVQAMVSDNISVRGGYANSTDSFTDVSRGIVGGAVTFGF